MKKVFIKYNPYKLETEIKIDGKQLAQNSRLRDKISNDSRLQEWVEELPHDLVDECNDTDFELLFHGTLPDYEDLTDVFTEAFNRNEITAKLDRKPAKETSDKEVLIDKVFSEIQKGPFDELRADDIVSAFDHAKSSDFEVCVVATMSSGKSTLINAMLGQKLMPSKQEACTAMITRIKDVPGQKEFKLEVFDENGIKLESPNDASLDTLNLYNSCPIKYRCNNRTPGCPKSPLKPESCQHMDKRIPGVGVVSLSGDIPFVESDDVSLVLIDTPGPNNARDTNHMKVQSELLGKSSKSLILYIMTGEFGTDDDNALLRRVAESMSVGGKQSKDRFIFVVNKLDDRKPEDGDTVDTLERVRAYLKDCGINNPNLFPACAQPALNIRLMLNGAEIDEDTIDEIEVKVKKLNRNKTLHFESYATLPPSVRGEINGRLSSAWADWDNENKKNENPNEALIHTGIVSIEAAIRQYVQKYAKTAKIKNIVDTFMHKLDEVGCFEETKRELAENQNECDRIVKQIDSIRQKMDSAKEAKKFKDAVDDAIVKINDDSKTVVDGVLKKFQGHLSKRISGLGGEEFDLDDVEHEVERLTKYVKKLEPDFEEELNELIHDTLINTSNALLDNYRNKLASLSGELNFDNHPALKIDPLKLMRGSVEAETLSVKHMIETKEVADGEEYVVNHKKKWYKPWTWGQESGYYRTKYKSVKYVKGDKLGQEFFAPVEKFLYDNADTARKHALRQSKSLAAIFEVQFKRLDDLLKVKLAELESFATDKKKAEERVKESKKKLLWLEQIKDKVESILEI